MAEEAKVQARDPEYPIASYLLKRSLVLRFVGQTTGLPVTLPQGKITKSMIESATRDFLDEYHRTYGFESPGETIELEAIRLVAKGDAAAPRAWLAAAAQADNDSPIQSPTRTAYFGAKYGRVTAPVISRGQLGHAARKGPYIIEGYDATTVIPPNCEARLDEHNNIIITVSK
jgi:N-methylhydantoinase A